MVHDARPASLLNAVLREGHAEGARLSGVQRNCCCNTHSLMPQGGTLCSFKFMDVMPNHHQPVFASPHLLYHQ